MTDIEEESHHSVLYYSYLPLWLYCRKHNGLLVSFWLIMGIKYAILMTLPVIFFFFFFFELRLSFQRIIKISQVTVRLGDIFSFFFLFFFFFYNCFFFLVFIFTIVFFFPISSSLLLYFLSSFLSFLFFLFTFFSLLQSTYFNIKYYTITL